MSLGEVFGHEPAVRMLRQSLAEQRLVGAYLFTGPPGVGKTTLALALAAAAACPNPRDDPFDACGACASCRAAASGQHPEITLIQPAGDLTQIWQFWDRDQKPAGALQHTLQYSPVIGRKRVYIIERAETLTLAAANSLLKALEEPPPYVLFVLLAPSPARLLPTVVSRCQVVRLLPVPVETLGAWIEAKAQLDHNMALKVAEFAEGCPGHAFRLAGDSRLRQEMDRILDIAMQLPTATPLSCLRLGDDLRKAAAAIQGMLGLETETGTESITDSSSPEDSAQEPARERAGRRQIAIVIELLAGLYGDLLSLNVGGPAARILHVDRRSQLAEMAARRSTDYWLASLEALLEARRRVDQNANLPLLVDGLAMRLAVG